MIISIDTECDKGPHWKIKRPLSFRNVTEGIPQRLSAIFDEFRIKPTYLISPEVLADADSVRLLQSMQGKGELGTHMHGEFIEPHSNWDTIRTDSFQGDFSAEIEFQKIKNLTKLFENQFGFRPKSFRAGRFGLSRYTLLFLEKLGYIVDSSVTPYLWWWRRKGEGVNYLGASRQPYFPSLKDFRRSGKMNILEVPISIINPFWEKLPSYLIRNINPHNRTQTILLNIFMKKKLRSVWLRPTFSATEQMLFVTNWIIKRTNGAAPLLNMMFHSNEVTPGTSPYNSSENDVNNFLDRLRKYFRALFSKYDVHSIGLSEATRLIKKQYEDKS